MDVAIHLGAHCTDADRLMKTLLRNRDVLSAQGIEVPGPGRYRDVLRDVMDRLRGAQADATTVDVVLETMLDRDEPARVVLSNHNFISAPQAVLDFGQIYPKIEKAAWLRNIFPDARVSFFLALRNPATFIPALFSETGGRPEDFPAYLEQAEPEILRWSDTVAALREACPDCPVTVWCYEDAPLYWGEIVRRIAGVDASVPLQGGFDMLRAVMSGEGMKRLRAYTKGHPPQTEQVRRQVMTAFLDKFALPEAVEEEITLPGWSDALAARLSALYENDMRAVAALDGVTLLAH
ncbi:hypothetical protein [Oceaniglobus roseus]|uniref:hypothetical protein n=1 Tax=Oceaniglobus roseus TaxID=1737570 RepID=UPI0012FFF7B6|nr:hypothetical protein [Kandeliimicrobium roseum]